MELTGTKSYPHAVISASSDEEAMMLEKVLSCGEVKILSSSRDANKVGIRMFTIGRETEMTDIPSTPKPIKDRM